MEVFRLFFLGLCFLSCVSSSTVNGNGDTERRDQWIPGGQMGPTMYSPHQLMQLRASAHNMYPPMNSYSMYPSSYNMYPPTYNMYPPSMNQNWMYPAMTNPMYAPMTYGMHPSYNHITPWMKPSKGYQTTPMWRGPSKGKGYWMMPSKSTGKGMWNMDQGKWKGWKQGKGVNWKGPWKGKGKGFGGKPLGPPTEPPIRGPATTRPTARPTLSPTLGPTSPATPTPTSSPTEPTTSAPTGSPSQTPSTSPSLSSEPTTTSVSIQQPSDSPSAAPTVSPTQAPSEFPSEIPSELPSGIRSELPSGIPSELPTEPVVEAIMTRNEWTPLGQELDGDGAGDSFGYTLDLSADGTILAVGALYNDGTGTDAGRAKVFRLNDDGSQWEQLGQDIDGNDAYDYFGSFVRLSADGLILAVGGTDYDSVNGQDSGHVRVYEYVEEIDQWIPLGHELIGESSGDSFGIVMAMSADGSILAVGALYNGSNGADSGHALVYKYDGDSGEWVQLGQELVGDAPGDQFGVSMGISEDGSILAVGGWSHDGTGSEAEVDIGHVRLFRYNDVTDLWEPMGQALLGEAGGDNFGVAVALSADGLTVAVGGFENDNDNGVRAGHVQIYTYDETLDLWSQLGGDIDGEAAGDSSGWTVDLSADGRVVAIGAYNNDGGGPSSGHFRVYAFDGSEWQQKGQDVDGEAPGEFFGSWVALSADGSIVAGGGDGDVTGHVRVFSIGGV